jgi:KDO2-lipid IV(A) lauroyltransferase
MTATPPNSPSLVPWRHRLEAAGAHLLLRAVGSGEIEAASALGGRLARRLGPLTGAHRTAADNLRHAFPDWDAARRRAVLDEAWDNFGRTMTEYAVLPRLWPEGWRARVTVSGAAALKAAAGKPAILFSGHLGNWEIIPLALAAAARPLLIVYRPPNNRAVDAMIGRVRAPYTAGMAPKGAAGARMILKGLAGSDHVFMVVDQKINTGLEIPLFGRGAFTGTAVAAFAMRFGCPVFPVHCIRTQGCRFEVRVEEPWSFAGSHDDEAAVRAALTRINARLEDWIREHPGQWLWMHRRWPR